MKKRTNYSRSEYLIIANYNSNTDKNYLYRQVIKISIKTFSA